MRKLLLIPAFSLSLGFLSCGVNDYFPQVSLTEEKMVEALQEALVLGSKTAASNLGDDSCSPANISTRQCVTGYLGNALVEILVPDTVENVLKGISSFKNSITPDAQRILSNLVPEFGDILNLGHYGDSIKAALNRGAEQAAPKSIEVFKSSILDLSIFDAKSLLMGDSVAATSYLKITTYSGLQSAFAPIIREPLNLLDPNKFWRPLASKYNSFAIAYSNFKSNPLTSNALENSAAPNLPYGELPEDISSALAEYATGKALDGLFFMVGKQESQLRADPWGTVKAAGGFITDTVGDLLGDVFGKAKDNLL